MGGWRHVRNSLRHATCGRVHTSKYVLITPNATDALYGVVRGSVLPSR